MKILKRKFFGYFFLCQSRKIFCSLWRALLIFHSKKCTNFFENMNGLRKFEIKTQRSQPTNSSSCKNLPLKSTLGILLVHQKFVHLCNNFVCPEPSMYFGLKKTILVAGVGINTLHVRNMVMVFFIHIHHISTIYL